MAQFRIVIGAVASLIVAVMILQSVAGPVAAPSAAAPDGAVLTPLTAPPAILPPGADWPTYQGSILRDAVPQHEVLINQSNVGTLRQLWEDNDSGAGYESESIVANGVVYEGSINGYEYAINSLTGGVIWSTYLGQDSVDPACGSTPFGIISSPTVSGGTIVLYGGDSRFYDLNTANGHILWSVPWGNDSQGYFGFGSPLVYNGYAYVGVASRCDFPLVPGGLIQISLATHEVVRFFNTTSDGALGDSIWSTPSLNISSNTLFVTTGVPNGTGANPLPRGIGEAIVELNATTLKMLRAWKVPVPQLVVDSDFGSTPVLFTPSNGHAMVAAANKNGWVYAWYQSNLTLAWKQNISLPYLVSNLAWSGSHLYVMGGVTKIGTMTYNSSVRELNPLTGAVIWRDGFNVKHSGYSSPLWVNAALIVAENQSVHILNAYDGATIAVLNVSGNIEAPPTISRGELYVGTGFGHLYAFDLGMTVNATALPLSGGPAPLTENFTATVAGGLPQYTYLWDFGDGGTSALADPSHVFLTAGTYDVLLTVTDLAGTSVSSEITITAT
jgi:outer membrane protein assembly factor BamB